MLGILLHRRMTGGQSPTARALIAMAATSGLALLGGVMLLIAG